MKLTRTGSLAAALALTAGAVSAQPLTVTYQISYTSQPHNFPSLLYFGDYARVVVNASFSPPVGTIVNYTSAAGPRSGPVVGLGMLNFDILGCDMVGGTWTLSGTGFQGTTGNTWGVRSGWSFGQPGTPQSNSDVINILAGQFPFPGASINPINPVSELWRGRWDYGNFISGRWLRLTVYPRDTTLVVRYGVDGTGQPLYDLVPATASPTPLEIFMDSGPPGPCTPAVMDEPQNTTAYTNGPATFHVGATWWNPQGSCGNFTYAWRRNCQTLTNGGNISGADTDTLRISPVTAADAGQYDVRVSGNHSYTATLTVLCYANCDASTAPPILNVNDFSCFLNSFAAGSSYANCDHSTNAPILNVLDFSCFLNQFAAGCP